MKDDITQKYIDKTIYSLNAEYREGIYVFACPICSPAYTKKKKYKQKNKCAMIAYDASIYTWKYHCQRCKQSMLLHNFWKDFDKRTYQKYHLEMDKHGYTGKGHNLPKYEYPKCVPSFPKQITITQSPIHTNEKI